MAGEGDSRSGVRGLTSGTYVRIIGTSGEMTDSSVEEVMAAREPLTEKERRQVQWAYHTGNDEIEARKQVIQELFGRDITRASCLAELETQTSTSNAIARSITETEFWDLLCCATYHQKVWERPSSKGNIRKWIYYHCVVMGAIESHEGGELLEIHTVPPPIPKNREINTFLLWKSVRKYWREVLGVFGLVWLLELLQEVVIAFAARFS